MSKARNPNKKYKFTKEEISAMSDVVDTGIGHSERQLIYQEKRSVF